jgi:hypothetical protein
MTDSDDLVGLISDRTGFDGVEVQAVLVEQQIPRKRVLPTRNRLRVRCVHFAGVKNLRMDDERGERRLEAFSFMQQLQNDVFAFASAGTNDAGKSTVLETILWAVRGTSRTALDVRVWMRHVIVELSISEDTFLVAWELRNGEPAGLIAQRVAGAAPIKWNQLNEASTAAMVNEVESGDRAERTVWHDFVDQEVAAGAIIGTFTGDDQFKTCVGDFMNSRFGFEEADVFTRNKKAIDPLDGHIATHGWPLWSQALRIPEGGATATIGEATQNTALLLEMYLGTTWGPTANAAKARKNVIEAGLGTLRRRQALEENERDSTVADLESRRARLLDERNALPGAKEINSFDSDLKDVAGAIGAVATASRVFSAALMAQLTARRIVKQARADFIAAEEAEMTKRFWHSLKPTCCPRCDEPVTEVRWAREEDGRCSLCDSDLQPEEIHGSTSTSAGDGTADAESDDVNEPIESARERLATLEAKAIVADKVLIAAEEEQTRTAALHAAAVQRTLQRGSSIELVRDLDRRIAVLDGRIEERGEFAVRPSGLDAQERIVTVLDAAEKVASTRTKEERSDLLEKVSEDITTLARRLGFHQRDRAEFRSNTHLPVVKGGAPPIAFGKCTPGEQLRLKIAVVIALLRNGTAAGVGRHPGLLIIDQITGEELNPENGRVLLRELLAVASETGLQVIVGSANGALMTEMLGAERVRSTRPQDDLLW